MTTSIWLLISLVTLVLYILIYRKINKLQKENKMTWRIGIPWLLFATCAGLVLGTTIAKVAIDSFNTSEVICKQYVIDYSYNVKCSDYDTSHLDCDVYKIDTCLLPYWDDITISNYGDSVYIIFWGDRYSWKWRFKSDKGFWIYRPSKGNSLVYDNGEYIMQTPDEQDAYIFFILDRLK